MTLKKRLAALLLAALMLAALFSFAGCKKGNGKSDPTAAPEKTAAPTLPPVDDAAAERIMLLAEAFARFGEYDAKEGFKLTECERMLTCLYRSRLQESDIPGYGRLGFDEADKALQSALGIKDLKVILRTGKNGEGQEIFAENGEYYILLKEPEYRPELLSKQPVLDEEGNEIGLSAVVKVYNKQDLAEFTMTLLLGVGEDGEFFVRKNEVNYLR